MMLSSIEKVLLNKALNSSLIRGKWQNEIQLGFYLKIWLKVKGDKPLKPLLFPVFLAVKWG